MSRNVIGTYRTRPFLVPVTLPSQADATASEVFQGIILLLQGAMQDLQLRDIPRRGAWGSVTAKNFPGAPSESFEQAIVSGTRKRGRG